MLRKKKENLEGETKSDKRRCIYTLLECHVNLDIEGFEDIRTTDW